LGIEGDGFGGGLERHWGGGGSQASSANQDDSKIVPKKNGGGGGTILVSSHQPSQRLGRRASRKGRHAPISRFFPNSRVNQIGTRDGRDRWKSLKMAADGGADHVDHIRTKGRGHEVRKETVFIARETAVGDWERRARIQRTGSARPCTEFAARNTIQCGLRIRRGELGSGCPKLRGQPQGVFRQANGVLGGSGSGRGGGAVNGVILFTILDGGGAISPAGPGTGGGQNRPSDGRRNKARELMERFVARVSHTNG